MKKTMFFKEEIEFEFPGRKIGKDEIEEIDDFLGKITLLSFIPLIMEVIL